MTDEKAEPAFKSGRRSKVQYVIEAYGLDGLGNEIEREWLRNDGNRMSLRDLAEYVNLQLLRSSLDATDERPIEGEIENILKLLRDGDAARGATAQAETKLKRAGIDVEQLQSDFVSHQAVHTYLTEYRDVSPPTRDDNYDPIETRRTAIHRLRNRLVAVIEGSLNKLSGSGQLSLGAFEVVVNVTVHCNDCDSTYPLQDLMDRGWCDCDIDS